MTMAIEEPNLFTLHGRRGLQVTLATSSFGGKPQLSYHDRTEALQFEGDEITFEDTVPGRIASVVLASTVDLGSTTFTLVIPQVNLLGSGSHAVHTVGLIAVHRTTIGGLGHGQLTSVETVRLRGNADQVQF
jgi:hypothetical protein